jgi:hypothetical protein
MRGFVDKFDAIMIPGGGVRAGGRLPAWTERRLERALERQSGEYLLTLSAGTPHRPAPVDSRGYQMHESRVAAEYLLRRGADPARVLFETCSLDTVGNAYFSLAIHVLPRRWRSLLVITSEFHFERTREAFEWVYGLAGAGGPYQLQFEAVSDAGLDETLLAARIRKEREGLRALRTVMPRISTLAEFHSWLFAEHTAYAAGAAAAAPLDAITRESY